MYWCSLFPKIVLPEDYTETEKWSGLARGDTTDARFLAALRVTYLYRLCNNHEVCSDSASQIEFILGCFLDTHWKLILFPAPIAVYMAYDTKLTPEQVGLTDVVHDEQMVPASFLENLWHDLQDSAVEPELKVLWRLLSKGLPRPSSIRYILKSLEKIFTSPEPDRLVVTLVRRFFLGAYHHVTAIAPPSVRQKLYGPDAVAYCLKRLVKMTSKELYIMLAEGTIAISRHHLPLYSLLQLRDVWAKYYDQAISVANDSLRRGWYNLEGNIPKPRSPKINIAPAQTKSPAYLVHQAFQRALNSNRPKQPVKIIRNAELVCSLERFYKLCRLMPTDDRIYTEMLRKLGVSDVGIDMLQNECTLIRNGRIQKQVNRIVGLLSDADRALLTLCFHYKFVRNSLFVQKLYGVPHRSSGNSASFIMVCYGCFSIRSQSRGFSKKKTKEGALIDTMVKHGVMDTLGQPMCSECHSTDVRCVDVANHIVHGVSINAPGVRSSITMCTRCCTPTKIAGVVGVYPFCAGCYKEAKAALSAQICICGSLVAKNGAPVLLQTDTGVAMFGLCYKHVNGFAQHFTHVDMPHINAVKTVLNL